MRKKELNILTIEEESLLQIIHDWQNSDPVAINMLATICYGLVKSMASCERNKKLSNANTEILNESATVYTNIALTNFIYENKNVTIETKKKLIKHLRTGVRNALVDKERYSNRKIRSRTSKVDISSPIVAELLVDDEKHIDINDLTKALSELEKYNKRQTEIIKYSYFVDLKNKEIAYLLGVSERLVEDELRKAKHWLAIFMEH
jgi:RNA polymerase sigma factor (sigma-70 family)